MSTIRSKLKEIVDALSELNDPPTPTAALSKALEAYITLLKEAKRKHQEEEEAQDLFAQLVNSDEATAKRKIDQLNDLEFKSFCSINRIKPVKGKKEKRVRGKIIQRKVNAKKVTKGKPFQPAIPEKREPDTIIPAQSEREATTQAILARVFQLKDQATI